MNETEDISETEIPIEVSSIRKSIDYSNPFPKPRDIQNLQKIDPRFVELLIDMTQKEQEYQHRYAAEELEYRKRKHEDENRLANKGLNMAFAFAAAILAATVGLSLMGAVWAATALAGGSGIAGTVAVFLQRKPRANKSKENE